ncbi:MAG: tRNA lysidine(34) synthetase TilS [Chitinophagaceae bacterium]
MITTYMDLLFLFKEYIRINNLFSQKDRLLLAVSGGVDSVVLCELCYQAGYAFTIAHCNFQLRGEESERDEQFVKELRNKYSVDVLVKKFDTVAYTKEKKISTQVAARELRYSWFNELLTQNLRPTTYDFLLTAHHLDDNIETLLMNFFKGTGITGLHGILPKQEKIIRPLLFAKREEIIAFAKDQHLDWVEDSSNASDKYSRNFIRHQVIPLIQKIYPGAENNLADNLTRFRDIELLYHQAIEIHKKKLIEQKGNEIHIPVLKLKKSTPLHSIVYEIIKDFGFHSTQLNEVISLLDSESGKFITSSSHRIIKNRNWLIIAPVASMEAETILIEEGAKSLQFAIGNLQLKTITHDSQLTTANSIALLDLKEIKFPLLLRKWKQGDYFYPLGMKKKKKLARFFIDQKLSKTEKEKVWVLEMDKKIIWVIGYRIDDRFKLTDKTKAVLQITFSDQIE